MMRFLGRSLTALFLLALTAGLLAWGVQIVMSALDARATRDGGGPPAREQVLAVNVVTATPETIAPLLTAFGEIEARRVLEVRATVGGRVIELAPAFEEGGRVAAGEVLLRIDPSGAEAALAVAEADVAGAEAELRDAERALVLARAELAGAEGQRDLQAQAVQRQRDLSERGVGAAAAVEGAELAESAAAQTVLTRRGAVAQAEARIDAARLAIDRARIALDEARRDLDDRTLVAAFDGVLGDVAVLRGGLVSANEMVATLLDPDDLEVAFRLSAAEHARLLDGAGDLVGAPVRAVLEAQGLELSADGRITREAAAVGEGRSGRQVYATLGETRGLRPGDFVRVEVEEPPLDGAIRLPATALSAQGEVLALGDDDRLESVPVTLLRRQGDAVLVAGDLGGRRVVAQRTAALGEGILVRAVEPARAASVAAAEAAEAPVSPVSQQPDSLVTLDPERRARLVAFVQDAQMPGEIRTRMLSQLEADQVPAAMVTQLEERMGG